MELINALKQNDLTENTKGGLYHTSTHNENLNLFCGVSRMDDEERVVRMFNNALAEDKSLALANLLYLLDIREGKGERRLFKLMMHSLCDNSPEDAKRILPLIGTLGRYDYLLVAFGTKSEEAALEIISSTLASDLNSDAPTLLAKWLPTHRAHGVNSQEAKIIRDYLGLNEKEYRIMLRDLRNKLNIIEHKITAVDYESIDFSKVPTKAMLRYSALFEAHAPEAFKAYKESVLKGEAKINTAGLFCYEVVKKAYQRGCDADLLEAMWTNQKPVFESDKNILVMADVSGSMTCCNQLPIASSIGLAMYTAEHNTGIFHNHFMTFSSRPHFEELHGANIVDKINNIRVYCENTNIDLAFQMLLTTAKENNISDNDMPSHIIIISDMEFDYMCDSKDGTNFQGWRKAYKEAGYTMPKIVFWNVAAYTNGYPATKFDNDCVMVSGFSTNILTKLLDVESFNPEDEMLEVLRPYIEMLA